MSYRDEADAVLGGRGSVGLDGRVWSLLHEALDVYRDSRAGTEELRIQLARFETPLRIAVVGGWRSGKSTLINAVLGEEVAPVEVPTGGTVLTWYEDGPEPRAIAYADGGVTGELAVSRSAGGLRVDLGGWRPGRIDDVVVRWPTRTLRHATFLDTPAPATDDAVASRILREADALLYLTRDGREEDLRFLESVQQGMVGPAAPVNVIMVLSRADELGGGRIDALLTATRLARRQRRDPRIGSLVVSVVPLAGLVALAGRLLSDADFAALGTLAALPRPELDECLLSTDRFLGQSIPVPLDVVTRRALLDRFGIFGIRLATTLVRTGCGTRAALAAELVRRGGLTELREALARYFLDRRETLKARTALVGLAAVLRAEPRSGSRELLARLEEILAGTHDFRELRLLAALRDGRVQFEGELADEAVPLLGGNGTPPAARLGVDHDATGAELWARGTAALRRWQHRAEDPLLDRERRLAARTVVRSCEGILAELYRQG